MPVGMRSVEAICCKPSEVTGSTEMPFSSIRNGYSFVPWVEPRYLTTRKRREETCSLTRWSSTMTQSETYSSSPWRVSVAFAAFAGDDGGHAFVFQPAKEAAQFRAQDERIGQAGEERFRWYPARRAWRRWSQWHVRGE